MRSDSRLPRREGLAGLSKKKCCLLIDGKNMAFRAGVVDDLHNKRNEPVYVSFVSLKMLRKLIDDFKPFLVLIAWDTGRSKWRQEKYPDYKRRHKKNSDSLGRWDEITGQISGFRNKVLPLFPILQWGVKDEEADDLICAAASALQPYNPVIVSTDQDFLQLLNIADVYNPITKNRITTSTFEDHYGFSPDRWASYRALVGDKSDNIPGIQGVGEKTATKILHTYNRVKDYADSDDKAKVRRKIAGEYGRYRENLALIDLLRYPSHTKLRSGFLNLLEDFEPVLDKVQIQHHFISNSFQSLLANFVVWIKPFEVLAHDRLRG